MMDIIRVDHTPPEFDQVRVAPITFPGGGD